MRKKSKISRKKKHKKATIIAKNKLIIKQKSTQAKINWKTREKRKLTKTNSAKIKALIKVHHSW